MAEGKSIGLVLTLLFSVIGVASGWWMMTNKSHKYYYPDVFGVIMREQEFTFTAERTGRYELKHKKQLGNLTFEVSDERGGPIQVSEFSILARLVNTLGYRGYAFHVDKPGVYRIAAGQWSEGAEVEVDYNNTAAIAGWVLAGMSLIVISAVFAAKSIIGRYRDTRPGIGCKPCD